MISDLELLAVCWCVTWGAMGVVALVVGAVRRMRHIPCPGCCPGWQAPADETSAPTRDLVGG